MLSVAAWFAYAVRELSSARFIAKLDDDAYLHAPDLERLLRTAHASLGASANDTAVRRMWCWRVRSRS